MTPHPRRWSPRIDGHRGVEQLEAILTGAERLGIPAYRELLALGPRADALAASRPDERTGSPDPAANRRP